MTVSSSPFLRLPPELRNHIYAYAFEDGELDVDRRYRERSTPAPGMVFACRQTYEEALVIYYAGLSVVSRDRWILKKWISYLNRLPESHQFKLIKWVYLDCRNRSEEVLPLQHGQRYALKHHSQLSLDRINGELVKGRRNRGEGVEARVCIASPDQQLLWTGTPFALGEALEDRWNSRSNRLNDLFVR